MARAARLWVCRASKNGGRPRRARLASKASGASALGRLGAGRGEMRALPGGELIRRKSLAHESRDQGLGLGAEERFSVKLLLGAMNDALKDGRELFFGGLVALGGEDGVARLGKDLFFQARAGHQLMISARSIGERDGLGDLVELARALELKAHALDERMALKKLGDLQDGALSEQLMEARLGQFKGGLRRRVVKAQQRLGHDGGGSRRAHEAYYNAISHRGGGRRLSARGLWGIMRAGRRA